MKQSIRRICNEKGQALVELALLLPFIMLLVIGVLELGRAWQHKQALTDAAREGARLSVVDNQTWTQDTVITRVKGMIKAGGFDSSTVNIAWPLGCRWNTGSPACSPVISENAITAVELTQVHQFVAIHRLMQLVTNNGTMTFRTTSRMRLEGGI